MTELVLRITNFYVYIFELFRQTVSFSVYFKQFFYGVTCVLCVLGNDQCMCLKKKISTAKINICPFSTHFNGNRSILCFICVFIVYVCVCMRVHLHIHIYLNVCLLKQFQINTYTSDTTYTHFLSWLHFVCSAYFIQIHTHYDFRPSSQPSWCSYKQANFSFRLLIQFARSRISKVLYISFSVRTYVEVASDFIDLKGSLRL